MTLLMDDAPEAPAQRLLTDPESDPARVAAAIAQLDERALEPYWFRPFLLNLMAILADRQPPEEVRRRAADAARKVLWRGWEARALFSRIQQLSDPGPELPGLDLAAIQAVLSEGAGLLLAPLQFGDCRHIQFVTARNRIHLTVALTEDVYQEYCTDRARTPNSELWTYIHPVSVQSNGGAVSLIKALRRGELVLAFVDGNAGTDGYYGDSNRAEFSFLNYAVRAKSGLVKLAAIAGAPIMPILFSAGEALPRCLQWPVIRPPGRLRGEATEAFAQSVMQEICGAYEPHVLREPQEWGQAHLFHRWRLPQPTPAGRPADGKAVLAALAGGGRLAMNRGRILEMPGGADMAWLDVRTLKSLRLPGEAAPLMAALAGPGVSLDWLEARPEPQRSAAIGVMADLMGREALQTTA